MHKEHTLDPKESLEFQIIGVIDHKDWVGKSAVTDEIA
jgi:hypothetical protein